ncbi:hypothetical protein FJ960_13095 [Mesorhizobium sp. B2-3-11]|uniref:hypothetical protein n=1 Tax=Mesorhizobium sp. B2-3-11 TaxID=2589953 RepID=UPI0011264E95|nr:hypothetical protein [Mesorhizobium sp. B2-3-11]TPM05350.1 hypothetical protein FJ960_13095 [Mesorhizobium sp. B2-3-11]
MAGVSETAADFTAQTRVLAGRVDSKYQPQILEAGDSFSAMGYALVDADGDPINIENARDLNERVSVAMHRNAYYGWGSFLPLTVPERAPQVRMSTLAGKETTYLEGMRVENTALISSAFDYWRIYECGIAVSVESFRDNWSREGQPPPPKHLTPLWTLVAIHSLLAYTVIWYGRRGIVDKHTFDAEKAAKDYATSMFQTRKGDDGVLSVEVRKDNGTVVFSHAEN